MENPYIKPGSVKVDDCFIHQGTGMPFIPNHVFDNIEQMLETFDRPEDLTIIESPCGGKALVLKRDLPYIRKREKILNDILQEINVDPKNLGSLSFELLMKIRSEITRKITEMN